MANSTHHISQSNLDEQDPTSPDQFPPPAPLNEIIERSLGDFRPAQFIQAILISLPLLFDGQQTFISVYTDAEPTWHCSTNYSTCNSISNVCKLSKTAWAWDGHVDKTIISEWGLECESSIITGLPASSYFMGCLIGGFVLATLGDTSLGRKNLIFLSCFGMSVTGLITIFSTNIWIYSSLRFVCGFFRASIITCALVLLTEMVGKQWRGRVGIVGFFCFTLGLLSLPIIAYVNRDSSWRTLDLWTYIPAILYCIIVYFFVIESPRWLSMQGLDVEAVAVLKRLGTLVNEFNSNVLFKQDTSKASLYSSMKTLFKSRWAFRRVLAGMALGFGMLLGVGNLGYNIYLSVAFNGLLDIPSYFLTFYLIERWNRKNSMLVFSIVSGLCSMLVVVVDGRKGVEIGLELASLFNVCMAFNVILIYTTELFPTSVRSSATSIVRQTIVFGAALSPLLISAGRKHKFLSYGVFGLVIICSGFFVVFLPETRGVTLSDTMDEQECNDSKVSVVRE